MKLLSGSGHRQNRVDSATVAHSGQRSGSGRCRTLARARCGLSYPRARAMIRAQREGFDLKHYLDLLDFESEGRIKETLAVPEHSQQQQHHQHPLYNGRPTGQ